MKLAVSVAAVVALVAAAAFLYVTDALLAEVGQINEEKTWEATTRT